MIRIAIIGDHKLACSGIAALLRQEEAFQVCGPFGFEEWRSLLSLEEPQLLLVVSRRGGFLPGQSLSEMRRALPQSRVVFISLTGDEQALLSALRSGVEGVLDVSAEEALLIRSIHDVLRGEIVISKEVARRLVGEYSALASGASAGNGRDGLTPREVMILRLIAEGESNKAIALRLSISEHTVRAHVRSIMRKLEVGNRVQAAAAALRLGLAAS